MKRGLVIALILVSILFVSGGCSGGITGNAISDNTIDGEFGYSSGHDEPQKKVKVFRTGHEQVCY